MADIYLNNSNIDFIDTFFDVEVDGNNLVTDDTLRTATLISIFTDASIPQIGTQIDGNTYGNNSAYSLFHFLSFSDYLFF